MAEFKISELKKDDPQYDILFGKITNIKDRKTAQYFGEGSTFLLLILASAFFIYRSVRNQFKLAQQQQNFMMAITHELKTPIAITKLNLETLQKRKLEETQQQRLILNTIQEANRLNALCNNMLLASQMEAGSTPVTKEEVNFTSLVSECIHDFVTRFPVRNFKSSLKDEVYVNGDMLLLQVAVNNLIDNAIKYSPKESTITVQLQQERKHIQLTISDEGKGIDDNEKKKVFDKFYRIGNKATKESKGTGLGLFLTKKIAQQHNARLIVTDNVPTGSNFTMVFD